VEPGVIKLEQFIAFVEVASVFYVSDQLVVDTPFCSAWTLADKVSTFLIFPSIVPKQYSSSDENSIF
jgi:hypothetical protein